MQQPSADRTSRAEEDSQHLPTVGVNEAHHERLSTRLGHLDEGAFGVRKDDVLERQNELWRESMAASRSFADALDSVGTASSDIARDHRSKRVTQRLDSRGLWLQDREHVGDRLDCRQVVRSWLLTDQILARLFWCEASTAQASEDRQISQERACVMPGPIQNGELTRTFALAERLQVDGVRPRVEKPCIGRDFARLEPRAQASERPSEDAHVRQAALGDARSIEGMHTLPRVLQDGDARAISDGAQDVADANGLRSEAAVTGGARVVHGSGLDAHSRSVGSGNHAACPRVCVQEDWQCRAAVPCGFFRGMTHLRRQAAALIFGLILVALTLLAPRPAQAQSLGSSWSIDMSGAVAAGVGGFFYLVGGTATFISLDVTQRSPEGHIPNGIGIAQVVYGATLAGAGALILQGDSTEFGVTLVGLGAGLALIPIIDWSTRGSARRAQTAFRLTPTSVSLSGTF